MTQQFGIRTLLLVGVASAALAPGLAQAAEAADAAAARGAGQFEEIVVTATRRDDTINRVPLSIAAINAKALERQEVRGIDDIRRSVPGIGLQFGNNGDRAATSGDTNISIRGIASIAGAATTGIYLDDVPLFKTAFISSGYGAAYPKVFDLERVEVLRGPQGTLFGGSTEGGAVRFITPAPSLTTTTYRVKAEGSSTKSGNGSYEAGVMFGGPIKEDVLGARVSVWGRHDGGWLDHVSRFTGRTLAGDTNHENAWLIRAALTWQATPDLTITPAFFYQRDKRADTDQFWMDAPSVSAPAVGYNAVGGGNCAAATRPPCNFVIPAHVYPAYDMFGPGKSGNELIDPVTGAERASLSPRDEKITVGSLTAEYDFGFASIKSISSYMQDSVEGLNDNTFLGGNPLQAPLSYPANEVFLVPYAYSLTNYENHLRRLTQELRITSKSDGRMTWVAGAYYSIDHFRGAQLVSDNTEITFPIARGQTYQQAFVSVVTPNGFAPWGGFNGTNVAQKNYAEVDSLEEHYAGYGEINYKLTEQLKLTLGGRYSHDKVDTRFIALGGQNFGNRTATLANGGLQPGSNSDSPTTVKFGGSYQISENDMVYATVAQGFRPGSFNNHLQGLQNIARGVCTLAALNAQPVNYGPDKVWSYEAGAKMRFGQVLQVNSSVYRIDWNDIQTQLIDPACGNYTANAGKAVSQGFDAQVTLKPIANLTVTSNIGYDDAHYKTTINGPGGIFLLNKDDRIAGVPKWTATVGATYDFTVLDRAAYISGDYQYAGPVVRGTAPNTVGYRADQWQGNKVDFVSMRAGIEVRPQLDFAFYVKNLTNSQDLTQKLGGAATNRPGSHQTFGGTFRPREIGISINYAH